MKGVGICLIAICVGVLMVACQPGVPESIADAYESVPDVVDFNYHVRPILADKCYHCHGPDQNSRKAELRLDIGEGAFAKLKGGGFAFVAHDVSSSQAITRILSEDPSVQMPPPESNLSLTKKEIATLYKWVQQGAEWKRHWSFIPPQKSSPPEDLPKAWHAENEIDNFILAKIRAKGVEPSPPADKERLLRRVTMDLTGLPPTVAEIEAFLRDNSDNAYEKVVDRLLKTDEYAERMAMEWLDVSRYADSHGLHADGYRYMWPWRDWVISAFKRNIPYDKFVTWQLAGDLLPDAGREQVLATAFNRNHPMTDEGGVIDEEFRLKYVADRTITTATAFLGMTMECASCHDHKFDPITQKEFYQLSAFFNNVKELGMTGADGNYGPMLMLPDSSTAEKVATIKEYIREKEEKISRLRKERYELNNSTLLVPSIKSIKGLQRHHGMESYLANADANKFSVDGNNRSTTKARPVLVKGKNGQALKLTGEYDELYLAGVGLFEASDSFSGGAWISTSKKEKNKTQTIMGNSGQKNNFWRGWDFFLDADNRISFRLIHSLPHNYLQVTSLDSIPLNEWNHVMFTYDGSSKAEGVRLYKNGKLLEATVEFDKLYKSIKTIRLATHVPEDRPLCIGKSYRLHTGEFGIYKGLLDEVGVFERELTPLEVKVVSGLFRSDEFTETEMYEYMESRDPVITKEKSSLGVLRSQLVTVLTSIDEVMVMEEMKEPRDTYVLDRGQYDKPGERVSPGTPEAILSFSKDFPANRLGLAKWIFSNKNPLTARVTVNRYWQMIFGKGLVMTANDFGNQGSLPSHPELLDWLAVYFTESGWDVRELIKKMVMSSTYRQSSVFRSELAEIDPENILLARSPSYRWPAEMIRDNALSASGLLVRKIGGESTKPYQPDGLWRELSNYSRNLLFYRQDSGENLYRRSMYTFIRRTSPPPFMTIFDAPNRDVCTMSRQRTNTPLQALVLMNDPQFMEASRVLASRVMMTGEAGDVNGMIRLTFRLATSRIPAEKEIGILRDLFQQQQAWFAQHPGEARELLAIGEYKMKPPGSLADVAAMTIVANTIFNYDESYMKR